MALVRVSEVSGRSGLSRFLRVPKELYPPSSLWVCPLDWERRKFFNVRKNPFFEHASLQFFVAVDSAGRDVGRIAAIENVRHNEFQGEEIGFFGFFESIDDAEVARGLIDAARGWVARRGYRRMRGPVNPSTNHECGLLVEGFDRPPKIQMTYNHPYYERLLLGAGCEPVKDLVAFLYTVDEHVPERLRRGDKLLRKRHGFSLRNVNLKKFDEELAKIKTIYNDSWSKNYGFVPLTDREIDYLAHDLRPLVDPDLAYIAEVGDEPAAFAMCLPDINEALKPLRGRLLPLGWLKLLRGMRHIKAIRAMLLGVRPRFRKMGIDYACYLRGLQAAQAKGFQEIEVSWVLADNVALTRPVERFGSKLYKRYRLYERETS